MNKNRPLALDLFCGAGGASVGLNRAGYDVVGVDINPQPSYPYPIIITDAIKFLENYIEFGQFLTLMNSFDTINDLRKVHYHDYGIIQLFWASPPCQNHSWSARRWVNSGRKYPDLIKETRELLIKTGKDYIIENVAGAPLLDKVMLCGNMFGLGVNRHRYFESNIKLETPEHKDCRGRIASGQAVTVAGHGGNSKSYKLSDWQKAMRIDWMTKRERNSGTRENPGNREDLCESIPPAYSQYLASQMIKL